MSNNKFPNHTQCTKVLSSDRSVMPENLCGWFFLKSNQDEDKIWKQLLLRRSQKEKNKFLTATCIIHGLYEEKSLIKISLIRDSSTEQRLFMLLPTLISMIVLTETFFDTRNSLKVKSSFAKVNFLLKTNTLDVSTTESYQHNS